MKRYYFDMRDGENVTRDDEGLEFPDLAAAQEEAAKALADIARDVVRKSVRAPSGQRMVVEVRDDTGDVMLAKFTFEIDKKK